MTTKTNAPAVNRGAQQHVEANPRVSQHASAARLPFIPAALDDLGLDVYAFRVYCRIARRAGDGGTCFESIPKMAKALGLWQKTVTRAVKELRDRRLVKVEARSGRTSIITVLPSSAWVT